MRDLRRVAAAHDFLWSDEELGDMIHCFDADDDGKVIGNYYKSFIFVPFDSLVFIVKILTYGGVPIGGGFVMDKCIRILGKKRKGSLMKIGH